MLLGKKLNRQIWLSKLGKIANNFIEVVFLVVSKSTMYCEKLLLDIITLG